MKKNLFNFLLICFVMAICGSCNEYSNDISPVAVFITPDKSDTLTVNAGDKIKYEMSFYADKGYVSRFQILSFDPYYGETVYKDTTLQEKTFDYTFVYTAPVSDKDSLGVTLRFYAWNSEGNKCNTERYITVKSKSILVAEKTGIVLWQPSLSKPDALSLANPTKTFHWETSSDSVYADVFVDGDLMFNNISLRSRTTAKFVRNNNFDYAAATAMSINSVYSSSIRSDEIADLRLNDIILVGHGNKAEGVFLVTNVIRDNTTDGCCIHLSFKGLD